MGLQSVCGLQGCFFFQAEDGIRDHAQSRGLGDVYKRQEYMGAPLEERIYRMRCVEGWSAVVPWVGIPFSELLKRVEVTGNARFVEFWSLADPEQMPYVRVPFLDWPYLEAVSYTHLTLPTICSVQISVVAVSLKKKQKNTMRG
eukprot:TRINITY_DN24688_c0_g1_i1.p3 TRINITY_DN24688_c0_g1~~TRINITY_DN24688_c0_g1_i1.p3  ORF type:complete len:144 (-),score=14.24 TRINITY_DN24688_c0_g1_i1:99-530(-)